MSNLHIQAVVHSLHEETVEQARQLVRTLFLATIVVLLIACANVADCCWSALSVAAAKSRYDGPGSTRR